jgi:Phosphoesterase family
MIFKNLGRSVSSTVVLLASLAAFAQVPLSQHVVLVIDENTTFNNVATNMPWLASYGIANGYASNYHSDNGGSLLDYLWLASGSCHSSANCILPAGTHNFNCSGDGCYYPETTTTDPITDDNIFREMNNAGISWKVYAQSYALAGGTLTTPDNGNYTWYYRRHNAAAWYNDVLNDVDGSAGKVVDLSQLAIDVENGTLPRFTIIVPDGTHDAHDCPGGMWTCTLAQKSSAADGFLSSTLTPILSAADFQPGGSGLLFVTFDECASGNQGCGAAVYLAVIGPRVKAHTVSVIPYKHENTLRTMLAALGITTLPGAAATAAEMSDFFTTSGSKPLVSVSSPANRASVGTSVAIQASAIPTAGHTITGWYVYVDSAPTYEAGSTSAIHPTVTMSLGTHTVLVRAWDNSGAFGDQNFSVTVVPKPVVAVSTPSKYGNVGSPVNIRASSWPTAGHTISGWWIYADGIGAYNSGAVSAINANLGLKVGTHTLMVRAWDTSGAYGDQTLLLTVSSKPAVAVSTPEPGSSVNSPINIQASATPPAADVIRGWYIYLDGAATYSAGAVSSITASVPANPGQHTLLIRAWDSAGAFGDQKLSLQVQPAALNISNSRESRLNNSSVKISSIASRGN